MTQNVRHLYLNHSALHNYERCPQLFAWENAAQLSPVAGGDPSLSPIWRGTLIHRCIDAMHSHQNWRETFEAETPRNLAAWLIPDARSGSIKHLATILELYEQHYKIPADPHFEVTQSEITLEMPLTPRITFCGTLDKVAISRHTKETMLVDHKTSSSLNSFLIPEIPLTKQFTGYIALAQANGIPTNSLLIDGISTARKALDAAVRGDSSELFYRQILTKSDDDLAEWKAAVIREANRMIEDLEAGTFNARSQWTCKSCRFYEPCKLRGSAQANYLRNEFEPSDETNKNFRILWEEN